MAWKIPVCVATLHPETGEAQHERAHRVQRPETHLAKCGDGQRPRLAAETVRQRTRASGIPTASCRDRAGAVATESDHAA